VTSLIGPPDWRGIASPEWHQQLLRDHCAAFVTGTWPAPYTLGFVEAWMTGIPVVHVGRRRFAQDTIGAFEIDRLIRHGESGFLVDDVDEARAVFHELMSDHNLCEQVSNEGRKAAIKHFGRATATEKWSAFLKQHIA
jgi:glycosyltransferase involved in cell wall biosynthesis